MPNRRIEYPADGSPLATVLDQLAAYQRHQAAGDYASAALAARAAETAIPALVDDALATAINPPASARQVATTTGIPLSTITYRARRRNRTEESQ